MASLIEKVGKQALRTFRQKSVSKNMTFEDDFLKLKALVDQLTAVDVNLHLDATETVDANITPTNPPVTYISIYEDSQVNIGIFIVRSGKKLPLHDHPGMYGILKVISGAVKIQSYTVISRNDGVEESSDNPLISRTLSALKLPEITINENSEACFLTPTDRNLHEIYSVGGAAAFLDILSPPYDTSDGSRSCHYYKEHLGPIENVSNETILMCIPSPPEYWSDVATYKGPRLRKTSS